MKNTLLLFEGISTDDLTPNFLVDLMDVAEEHGLSLDGISVRGEETE